MASAVLEVLSASTVVLGVAARRFSWRVGDRVTGTSIGSESCRVASAVDRLADLERARDLPCLTRITHQIETMLPTRGISPSCHSLRLSIKE
jgi:hypothetical protein